MADIEKAIWWFENRIHDTPMPGSKRMYRIALDALREKQTREADKTRGGAIRQMSDADLAKTIVSAAWCKDCRYSSTSRCGNPDTCIEVGTVWLGEENQDG